MTEVLRIATAVAFWLCAVWVLHLIGLTYLHVRTI
jgi:hypothetical protein